MAEGDHARFKMSGRASYLHAGHEMFADDFGKKIAIAASGIRALNLLGGPWRASNFTYAEATWTQSLPDWIGGHKPNNPVFGWSTRCLFRTISRAASTKPRSVIPRSITTAGWPTTSGVGLLPTRPHRPRHKALSPATVIRCAPGEWRTIIAVAASRSTVPDTGRSSASTTKPLRF